MRARAPAADADRCAVALGSIYYVLMRFVFRDWKHMANTAKVRLGQHAPARDSRFAEPLHLHSTVRAGVQHPPRPARPPASHTRPPLRQHRSLCGDLRSALRGG
jgi:hypothetical protein